MLAICAISHVVTLVIRQLYLSRHFVSLVIKPTLFVATFFMCYELFSSAAYNPCHLLFHCSADCTSLCSGTKNPVFLKLQNVFVLNCRIYLFQISKRIILICCVQFAPSGLSLLRIAQAFAPTKKNLYVYFSKGPGSLKGLVKLWTICVFRVLPGLQMDSKADRNPHVT